MIRYVFREPLTIKGSKGAKAQVIGEALESIRVQRGGNLTPSSVWQAAQDEDHALHPYFEWDVKKAAQAHWDDQARTLIRSVRVIEKKGGDSKPAFLSINDKGHSYRSIQEIVTSVDLQMAVIKAAKRDLDAFDMRYRDLQEICDMIKPARQRLAEKIEKSERPQA